MPPLGATMKKRVFITRQLPPSVLAKLEERLDCRINREDRKLSKGEIIEGARDCEGILCLLTDEMEGEIMEGCPSLKVISNLAVGFNNIRVEEATRRGVLVTNTPGVLTETTADFAFGLLLAIARRMVEADHYLRSGKFKEWGLLHFLGQDVYGKKLGILGMGRIGMAVARRAKLGFGMEILYCAQSPNEEGERELAARRCSSEELFRESDFLSIHLPLNSETHHFVDEKLLGLMKPSACLINTARGPIINEAALVKVLKEEKIFGAALDVFEREPEVHPKLLNLKNTLLVPHIASASVETRTKMAGMAAENLILVLEGKNPLSSANPEVLS